MWEYKAVSVPLNGSWIENIRNLSHHGVEGWELVQISFQNGYAVFKRPFKHEEESPMKEEVKPMNFEGYRAIISLSVYIAWKIAEAVGLAPDTAVSPEKKTIIDQILLAAAGIFSALKINRLLKK